MQFRYFITQINGQTGTCISLLLITANDLDYSLSIKSVELLESKQFWSWNVMLSSNLLLLSAGGEGRFEVDRKNGQVRTTGLPLQRDREYLLTVVAADRLGSRSAPVVVSVVAGARPPQFTNASFTIAIPENTPEGQP